MSSASPSTSPEALIVEEQQLQRCRWAFLLLGAGLLLHIAASFLAVEEPPKSADVVVQTAFRIRKIFEGFQTGILMSLLTLVPGAILLARNARADRWRWAAYKLLAVVFVDLTLMGLVVYLLRGTSGESALPRAVHFLIQIDSLLLWPELWYMAVLVAEFAMAARAVPLLEQTERLAYALMAGTATSLAFVGWTLPIYPFYSNLESADDITILLAIGADVLAFFCVFWTLRELASAATLARLLGQRSLLVRQQTANPLE